MNTNDKAPAPSEAPAPPGMKLRHTFTGHDTAIGRMAWSPDGRVLATPAEDCTVRLWDLETGRIRETVRGETMIPMTHIGETVSRPKFTCVSWSPDGSLLALGSKDKRIRIWDTQRQQPYRNFQAHDDTITCVAWSPTADLLASASDDRVMKLWDPWAGQLRATMAHEHWVTCVAWSPSGKLLATASADRSIGLWEAATGKLVHSLKAHLGRVTYVAWSPSGKMLASCSTDAIVRVWDLETGRTVAILEGHSGTVRCVSFAADESLLASKSCDGTVRLWRPGTWELLAILEEPASRNWAASLAFHPREPILATLGDADCAIRIWELEPRGSSVPASDAAGRPSAPPVHYTNAKAVLVGDTGVGKSGLGLVLSGQPFVATESTHGRNIWRFDTEQAVLENGSIEEREILLWDLAGQPGYRLIHQLHLGEVAVALIVFDARNEADAFAGVRHWERALRQARRAQGGSALPLKKFLVAARADRGGPGLSAARIEAMVRDLGCDGYFETSAKEGRQVKELAEAIRAAIAWEALPRVTSTELFQNIKAMLLEEKMAGQVLSTTQNLYRTFLRHPSAPADSEELHAQFFTCIGRVESQGLIRRLSFGDLILLQPELLDAYASALINAAKDEPDGLGSIAEDNVRACRFAVPSDSRIADATQEKLLLIAMIEDLLRHDIALREQADDGPYLVFPSQLTRESPDLPDPEGKTVIFTFEGPVLSVYATLAVRLARSGLFRRKEMWKNAATYTASVGGTCGVFLRGVDEGRGELILLFDRGASKETRLQFEDYVHTHLQRRALAESIERRRILVCHNPDCATPVTDLQVRRRLERGYTWIVCNVCGERVSLAEPERGVVPEATAAVSEMDRTANAHRDLDAGLVSASGEMRSQEFRDWAGATQTMLALVFTDIIGSTALTNELGNEAMRDLRHAHFQEGRRLLTLYGGYEIKTMGDAFMVAFRTATQALNFALAFQADSGHPRIHIRAGIHVGHVYIEEGDAFGSMVNFTARVEAQAGQAEIWVSDRAKSDLDEIRSKVHERLHWTEHPDCVLKGFPGRQRLWSVNTAITSK